MSVREEFNRAMRRIYTEAEKIGYRPTKFLGMMDKIGELQTAKTLINMRYPSEGYTRLYNLKRLDLTVEAAVLNNPDFHALFFPEELDKARSRLRQYGYKA